MTTRLRTDEFQVTVSITGKDAQGNTVTKDYGNWLGRSGGMGDSEETKLRLGGMGPQVSLGGAQTMDNLTCRQIFDSDDIGNDIALLMAWRGKAKCSCTTQPLDADGHAHGSTFAYTGTLKAVTPPAYDAQGNEPAYIEIEIATDGTVA